MAKPYYFGTIRKIVAGFGTLFADINIDIGREDGTFDTIKVPLNYGSRKAWYLKLLEKKRDKEGAARIAQSLPRISFEMKNLAYSNVRKTSTFNRTMHREEQNKTVNKIYRQYAPIPYDFDFTVSIAVKNIEDGLRIMEQIIPMFRPDHTITIEELPALKIKEDVTVNMRGISQSGGEEGLLSDSNDIITWDIEFMVAGHIFPPIKDATLIREIDVLTATTNSNKSTNIKVTRKENKDGTWEEQVQKLVPK